MSSLLLFIIFVDALIAATFSWKQSNRLTLFIVRICSDSRGIFESFLITTRVQCSVYGVSGRKDWFVLCDLAICRSHFEIWCKLFRKSNYSAHWKVCWNSRRKKTYLFQTSISRRYFWFCWRVMSFPTIFCQQGSASHKKNKMFQDKCWPAGYQIIVVVKQFFENTFSSKRVDFNPA
jgi:hypothetical protein